MTLVDMEAAAAGVDRPWSTIRRWVHEGRIPKRGKEDGRILVAFEDVQAVARQTNRRGRLDVTPMRE